MTTASDAPAAEPGWVDDVLRFWLVETPAEKRFRGGPEVDAAIAARFSGLYAELASAQPE